MSKPRPALPGRAKILDAWVPPEEAGDAIGCVATTFTFSPVLFEEECLARFVHLESNASEDGAAYLVEREEKIAQLLCAAVLVDQHHAKGTRNLRWDLLPARLSGSAILHAKVSLLLWSRHARLIVASANLTEDGYRRNHEIFGVLDYHPESQIPLPVLDDFLLFLDEAVSTANPPGGSDSPAVSRWRVFLERVKSMTREWGIKEYPRSWGIPRVYAVLTGPNRDDVFTQLGKLWTGHPPPDEAYVLSPFFDPPHACNRPAKTLLKFLKQRGKVYVQYDVTAEEIPGERAALVHAPAALAKVPPDDKNRVKICFGWLKPAPDDFPEEGRPIHAKSLWLRSNRWLCYMIGSSNFTSPGYGLDKTRNLEANLAYLVDYQQNPRADRAWQHACLPVEEFPHDWTLRFQPQEDEQEDTAPAEFDLLPPAFGHANVGLDEQQHLYVEFAFTNTPPAGWKLFAEDDQERFTDASHWNAQGNPLTFRLRWPRERPPSYFRVTWQGCHYGAYWPVNIIASTALPPPPELNNLPLEVLMEILSSARPLHQVLHRWLRRSQKSSTITTETALDPHRRVNTSSFLLQRTRRVSNALTALRRRLQMPVASEAALTWRLHGPIGVLALAKAISQEARSEPERCFLLAELCLELKRVQPQTTPGCLPAERIREALQEIIREISTQINAAALNDHPRLAAYVKRALAEDAP
ncbi:hypothetical protein NXS98_00385 [Fontisphaera persica]|uniref:hypothetical protein n=1 Tax=Fontisphaera persica TaxID=2974023 RepID=UPI0024C06B45|nr:hypothetical protein [Fontisphaera persica]WCJ59608.1 hypothetical protein NXS98_00385 [Fontisphaera persica]